VHPIAFHIGKLSVHWYGVFLATAFLVGLWTASRRAPLTGVAPGKISDAMIWLMVGAVVGARILYVATYWRESFAGHPWWEVFMIQRGGLVYYGGLVGASLACILYVRLQKLPLWKVGDIFAPSVALGYVFGRIGCLMNGCCYGRACSLPWAITFPANETGGAPAGVPIHPTQIYDSILNLVLYGGLAWLYRRKKFDGQVFATYLMGYAITRSIVEIFRGDYNEAHRHAGLTPGHLVSVAIFAVGVAFWMALRKPVRSENR
jgi:phosphatidylglycerol:prolipoprotein diacylglycerol transferase